MGDGSQLFANNSDRYNIIGSDIKTLVLDTFKQIQGSIDEVREGWSATKDELAKLTNAYEKLNHELAKYTIRLNMLENQLGQAKKLSSRLDALSSEMKELKGSRDPEEVKILKDTGMALEPKEATEVKRELLYVNENAILQKTEEAPASGVPKVVKIQKSGPSLEPDKLKEWEEWKEPKEWQEGSE